MWIRGWIGNWFDMDGTERVMYNGAEAMRIETVSRARSSILREYMKGSHDVVNIGNGEAGS